MKKLVVSVFAIALLVVACSKDDNSDGGGNSDSFDRKAMLQNMADNIILPSYQNFKTALGSFQEATTTFTTTATRENLVALRSKWVDAYKAWQHVSMFEIGKAEELRYKEFMNIYPTNTTNIKSNISGTYDLTSISLQDEQGFPALDYLINGLGESDADILVFYTTDGEAANYKKYMTDLVARMTTLTDEVVGSWTNGYRDTFVNSSGSSATSSLDKMANDYVYHYEKNLRAGKVGIPAGVWTGTASDNSVEALYKGDLSKVLLLENLTAMQNLFNGVHFGKTTTGESFKTYLDFLNTLKNEQDLSKLINNQFDASRTAIDKLGDDFSAQVRNNNESMLETYSVLQKNVPLLKVDMFSAMSIRVDYVDADGD
ncbi:imelysin family protein [Aquimarina sp. TRL1]|uniref:imelysin family protein n=1 Tax=Aquimarina sp. (strain TRL1) TaxID=2736252 RepID=UPI00158E924A|nr:imelysin family protein [Aquimarina sp. TRL1]QKX05767.1 imelysin family protein [Aquimarina sp. TRL1]